MIPPDYRPLIEVFPALEWPSTRQILKWIDRELLLFRDINAPLNGRVVRMVHAANAHRLAAARPATMPNHESIRLDVGALEQLSAVWYERPSMDAIVSMSWSTDHGPRILGRDALYNYARMLGLPQLQTISGGRGPKSRQHYHHRPPKGMGESPRL